MFRCVRLICIITSAFQNYGFLYDEYDSVLTFWFLTHSIFQSVRVVVVLVVVLVDDDDVARVAAQRRKIKAARE